MNTALRIVVLIALATLLAGFTGVPEDVRLAPTCSRCGMDRTEFAHSRKPVRRSNAMMPPSDDATTSAGPERLSGSNCKMLNAGSGRM